MAWLARRWINHHNQHRYEGIDLRGKVETTTLRKGQSLKMATPTMDSGIIWKVTLLDITPREP